MLRQVLAFIFLLIILAMYHRSISRRHLEYFPDFSNQAADDRINYFRMPSGIRDIGHVIAFHSTAVDRCKRMLPEMTGRQHSTSTGNKSEQTGSQFTVTGAQQYPSCVSPRSHVTHQVTAPTIVSGCRLPTAVVAPMKRTDLTMTSFDNGQTNTVPTWRQAAGVHLPPFETFRAQTALEEKVTMQHTNK
jgi:hypothetical protein